MGKLKVGAESKPDSERFKQDAKPKKFPSHSFRMERDWGTASKIPSDFVLFYREFPKIQPILNLKFDKILKFAENRLNFS